MGRAIDALLAEIEGAEGANEVDDVDELINSFRRRHSSLTPR